MINFLVGNGGGLWGGMTTNRMSRGDHSKMIADQLPVDGGVGNRKNIKSLRGASGKFYRDTIKILGLTH